MSPRFPNTADESVRVRASDPGVRPHANRPRRLASRPGPSHSPPDQPPPLGLTPAHSHTGPPPSTDRCWTLPVPRGKGWSTTPREDHTHRRHALRWDRGQRWEVWDTLPPVVSTPFPLSWTRLLEASGLPGHSPPGAKWLSLPCLHPKPAAAPAIPAPASCPCHHRPFACAAPPRLPPWPPPLVPPLQCRPRMPRELVSQAALLGCQARPDGPPTRSLPPAPLPTDRLHGTSRDGHANQ